MDVKMVKITPDMAKEYLEHNVHNRKPKLEAIRALVREIQRGEYVPTHQGIAFDEKGHLVDGQQRLMAIVQAGIPVDMLVTTGLPEDAINVIDRGVTRSVKDVMEISNDPSMHNVKVINNPKVIAAINALIRESYRRTRVTPNDTRRVFFKMEKALETIYDVAVCKNARKSIRGVALAAALAAMEHGIEPRAVSAFFQIYTKGDVSECEDYNINAALYWSRVINEARIAHIFIDASKLYLLTQNALYHFANNTSCKQFRAIDNPRYPMGAQVRQMLEIQEEEEPANLTAEAA